MQSLRVAAITMNARLGEVDANLEAIEQWSGKAREAGADLVLFPELATNGHCDPEAWDHAEEVPCGPSTRRLNRIAARYRLFVSAGLTEKRGDLIYNTQVLIGPEGFVGAQRKIHLSRDEAILYSGGDDIRVFDIGKCRVGIGICYDNWFPEVPRMLALQGAEVILMPHASRMKMWSDDPVSERAAAEYIAGFFRRIYPARAFENACYAVVCNQAGRSGFVPDYAPESALQPHHAGGAMVIDPRGEIVAATEPVAVREEMLVADLTPQALASARSDPNYQLRRRRGELLRRIEDRLEI